MIKLSAEKLSGLFSGEKRVKIIVIILIIAVTLIFISEMFSDETIDDVSQTGVFETEAFEKRTEERIEVLLQSINGVGKAEVMVTIEGGARYTYALENTNNKDLAENSNGDREERNEDSEKYIIIDNGSGEEALTEYYELPRVSGVVVVCDGGGSTAVRERVISAITTALDIGSDKVYVTEKN